MSKTEEQEGVLAWRKSKYSINNGACTEVAAIRGSVLVRDSLGQSDVKLRFASDVWHEFTARLKAA
jgi:Domain of unknown function (DUF397)